VTGGLTLTSDPHQLFTGGRAANNRAFPGLFSLTPQLRHPTVAVLSPMLQITEQFRGLFNIYRRFACVRGATGGVPGQRTRPVGRLMPSLAPGAAGFQRRLVISVPVQTPNAAMQRCENPAW
jgi:hypothetical protein